MNKGLIKISDVMYKQDWHILYIFMKDFRPTHIEFRHWENDIWYMYGVSDHFDVLKEGDLVPQYDIVFTKQGNGSLAYKFQRVNN